MSPSDGASECEDCPAGNFSSGDGTVTWFGERTYLQVADPPVGVLFFLALSSIAGLRLPI